MKEPPNLSFGLVIAVLVPGFMAVWALSARSDTLRAWLATPADLAPGVGGVLYSTIAAIGAGMACGAVRWLLIDTLHHRTGLCRPAWDERLLAQRLPGFDYIVENHYRYYQFYANSVVAIALVLLVRGPAGELSVTETGSWIALAGVFLLASRNALARYCQRAALLLSVSGDPIVTNGNHHPGEAVASPVATSAPAAPAPPPVTAGKPAAKPPAQPTAR